MIMRHWVLQKSGLYIDICSYHHHKWREYIVEQYKGYRSLSKCGEGRVWK